MELVGHLNDKSTSGIDIKALVDNKKCGFCGCTKLDILSPYSLEFDINFIQCAKCGAVTYDKIVSQEAIDKQYTKNTKYYAENDDEFITFYGAKRFAKHLMKHIPISAAQNGSRYKILDFGGGNGALAYVTGQLLKETGKNLSIDITVVDYCKDLYKSKDADIFMKRTFPIETINKNEKFDLIIASAVIEHLPAPQKEVKSLFGHLANGGILYFRTPYIYPIWKSLIKLNVKYDTQYPFHMWDLGGEWYDNLPSIVGYDGANIQLVSSRPSIVEASYKQHFFKALFAHLLKAPWFIFKKWRYVGGWEAIYKA